MNRCLLAMGWWVLAMGAVPVVGEEKGKPPTYADTIVWGKAVNGLQLGISPPVYGKKEIFDGQTIRGAVHLRSVGPKQIRLLTTMHACLAMGPGKGSVLATKINLLPERGGEAVEATYRGANHLRLLGVNRLHLESWQETLARTQGQNDLFQLKDEDARHCSIVLAPGQHWRTYTGITFVPGQSPQTAWQRKGGAKPISPAKYRLTATLKVDHAQSGWKGELVTGSLPVAIRAETKKAEPDKSAEMRSKVLPGSKNKAR